MNTWQQGKCEVTYVGHSTVLLTTELGKRVVFDPWFAGNPRCPATLEDPGKVDFILLTHGHNDHTASAVQLAKKYGAMLFATYELAMLMVREGVNEKQVQPMNKGGTVTISGSSALRLSLTNAFHSSSYDASDGKTYYAGEPCGIVLGLESGRTVYHAGDTALFRDMELIGELYHPELALLPIGDRFTMGPEQAAVAARFIKPRVVIPIHHGTFDLLTGTPSEFTSRLQGSEIRPVVLEPGEKFIL